MRAVRDNRKAELRRCTEVLRDLVLGYRAEIEAQLQGTAVTLAQLRMLKAVRQQQELSAAAIARLCQITPQTLQSMLTRAAREGWIVRGTSDRNHRFVTATLTAEGEAVLQRGLALVDRIEERTWSGVSIPALQAMRKTLHAGLANLRRD